MLSDRIGSRSTRSSFRERTKSPSPKPPKFTSSSLPFPTLKFDPCSSCPPPTFNMDPETLEISGLKPLTILPREGIHEVPGSGKKPWKIKRTKDDAYTCTCSRWQFQKGVSARLRTCSHIEAFLGPKYDAARLAMEVSCTGWIRLSSSMRLS